MTSPGHDGATSTPAHRRRAACAALAVLLLPACAAEEPGAAGPTSTRAASADASPAPADPTTSPTSSAPEPVATLAGAPFSGYEDVQQEVVEWRLECSADPSNPGVVPDAVTMGTAEQQLDDAGSAFTVRQVAVFGSVDAASAAADQLAAHAREQCAGEVEAEPGVVVSTTVVEPLDVGAQGLLVETVAEDGAGATAVLRRGNAVALVQAVAAPEYVPGRTVAEDARAGAQDVFEQLCTYEQAGC